MLSFREWDKRIGGIVPRETSYTIIDRKVKSARRSEADLPLSDVRTIALITFMNRSEYSEWR